MTGSDRHRVVIAGGRGLLGRHLADHLVQRGYDVVVLSRQESPAGEAVRAVTWDARTPGDWTAQIDGARAVVNLVGRSVDCIKTPERCDEILRSRVEASRIIGTAINRASSPPACWVQMSTAHIYGDPPNVWCNEDSAFGYGLAPTVGRAWEAAMEESIPECVRGVILRTSFVLTPDGGALPRLARLARLGLGGPVGSGRQGMSWIHVHDMNRLFQRAIDDEAMRGAYIASAPNPVSNREFMKELRHALRMPIGLPASSWMVRIGAPLFMRTDPELALYGRYCVSRRLDDEGFAFRFPCLQSALSDLFNRSGSM